MEALVKHFGAGLLAMAVIAALAVIVLGIVKSDAVTAQFQDTLTAFLRIFVTLRDSRWILNGVEGNWYGWHV